MFIDDVIAAISTPVGHSGIGIVRLSGRDSIKIADKIFTSLQKRTLKKTPTHRLVYGHIINSRKEIIDEVLVSVMKAPHTYTKENIVEINCHGGPVPLRRILALVLKNGARLAEPGEFTRRAFLNKRIDLAQAEAVLDVINSLTEQSRKTAVEQLSGGLSKKTESIREGLLSIITIVEAYIDFPEEEIEFPALKEMKKTALSIRKSLRQLIESSQYGMILRDGLKTAIIGRPNVGKSSLLNALLEQDRAIVTEVPGTTRDIIEDYLNIHGLPVKIMDTAGIRKVEDIAEKEGVKRSHKAMKDADLVLIVLDGSESLHDTDKQLISKSDPKNTLFVINKADLPQKIKSKTIEVKYSKTHTKEHKESTPPHTPLTTGGRGDFQIVKISALKGKGIKELKNKIVEVALQGSPANAAVTVTNIRHVHVLKRTLKSVDSFIKEIDKKTSPEFLSVELREALDAIGEITGATTSEDILNKIFTNFCIGK
ncbi:MAG: tRNA uridine-5-carboxymethylaminomethyl(34) synthesis GTPase MnmE [Nitrospirota bacterium]